MVPRGVRLEAPPALDDHPDGRPPIIDRFLRKLRGQRPERVAVVRRGEHLLPDPDRPQPGITRPGTDLRHEPLDHVQFATRTVRLHVPVDPERELAAIVQRGDGAVVPRPDQPAAGHVANAGHAETVELAEPVAGAGDLIIGRGPGDLEIEGVDAPEPRHHPGGLPGRVLEHLAAERILGLGGEPHGRHRRPVHHRLVVEVLHPDRMVGRDRVEVSRRRLAVLGELALVPAARHHDPRAGRGPCGPRPDHPEALRERGDGLPVQFVVPGQALPDRVDVRVDEPRDDRAAVEIDHPGRGTNVRLNLAVRANRHELPFLDRGSLRGRELAVHGDDLAAEQDEVGGWGGGPGSGPRTQGEGDRQASRGKPPEEQTSPHRPPPPFQPDLRSRSACAPRSMGGRGTPAGRAQGRSKRGVGPR